MQESSDFEIDFLAFSHLRQHMMLGDPVIIRYRDTSDGPVAVRILDVAPS